MCERKEESPVYVVEPEKGGQKRTVHRNMLFHCGEELPDAPESDVVCQKAKDTSQKGKSDQKPKMTPNDDTNSDSDSEEDAPPQQTPRSRQKTNRFTYKKLGNPTINILQTNMKNDGYRSWLNQLWISGYITDLLIKQRYTTPKCT